MDLLMLLKIVVAFTVYPGGLFFAGLTYLLNRVEGKRSRPLDSGQFIGLSLASFGAALLPLPGSGLQDVSSAGFLFAALLFAAAGLGAAQRRPWPRSTVVAAATVLLPLLLLSAASTSQALPTIATLPGPVPMASRALIAASLSLSLPLIASTVDGSWLQSGAIALIGLFEAAIAWQMLSAAPLFFGLLALFFVIAVVYAHRMHASPSAVFVAAETLATGTAIPALAATLLLLLPI